VTNTFINDTSARSGRARSRRRDREQDATDGVLVHAAAHDKQSPRRALVDRSVSDDVQRALDQLPDDFRTA